MALRWVKTGICRLTFMDREVQAMTTEATSDVLNSDVVVIYNTQTNTVAFERRDQLPGMYVSDVFRYGAKEGSESKLEYFSFDFETSDEPYVGILYTHEVIARPLRFTANKQTVTTFVTWLTLRRDFKSAEATRKQFPEYFPAAPTSIRAILSSFRS